MCFFKNLGEKEEQPPPVAVFVVQDLTLTLAPSIKVLVESKDESDLIPTAHIYIELKGRSSCIKLTVSLEQIVMVAGAVIAPY